MNNNGFLIINKEKGYTSRDVVNLVSKILNIKKVGHTGTLDPLAEGVLVLCLNKYTSLSELVTSYDKEYLGEMSLGIETDTLDTEGVILNTKDSSLITDDQIKEAFNYFNNKSYNQEVPLYSAVKINGKKLYEYARNNIKVELPKRCVTIYQLALLDIKRTKDNINIKFKTKVSKGTYIRSLIRDIALYLDNIGIMTSLTRIKQGNFKIEDSYTLDDLKKGNYKLLKLTDVLNIKTIKVDDPLLLKKIKNGSPIPSLSLDDKVLFTDQNNQEIAIYQKEDNHKWIIYKML